MSHLEKVVICIIFAATAAIDEQGKFSGVLRLLDELLNLFGGNPIDCEFAVSGPPIIRKSGFSKLRPLILNAEKQEEDEQAVSQ